MSAPSHEEHLLGAYALDLLDPEEAERIRRHLASCPACRAEYAQLRAARAALRRIPPGALRDGPLPNDDAWRRALRTIRAEKRAIGRPRRRTLALVASVVAFAGALGVGVIVGRGIGPLTVVIASPPPASQTPVAGRHGSVVDANTHVAMTATIVPADGWVRVKVSVTGVPVGENCRLEIMRRDGTTEIAAGWMASKKGESAAVVLDGSAAVAPADVVAVVVRNTAGKTFVTVVL